MMNLQKCLRHMRTSMKNYLFPIYESELKAFNLYCRDIKDYVSLILLIARKLKTSPRINPAYTREDNFPFLRVYVDKFSRAFIYVEQNKYFSVTFPLNIKIDNNNNLTLYIKNAPYELSNKAISDCIGVVNTMKESGVLLEAWVESSIDNEDHYDYEMSILNILECLFSSEPGYVRYDYDPEHKKKNHPEIHLDVNMSRDATFKLGLYEKLSPTKFKDIIDNNSNCSYLSDFEESNTVNKKPHKPTKRKKSLGKRRYKK